MSSNNLEEKVNLSKPSLMMGFAAAADIYYSALNLQKAGVHYEGNPLMEYVLKEDAVFETLFLTKLAVGSLAYFVAKSSNSALLPYVASSIWGTAGLLNAICYYAL